ncbi:MAG: arabinan endo-1,5-alpha-L-arabinosidase [Pirellulales bacterium]|nr:arabinan endo-1,5-alpha-L-arabinosidase [Pirellulales bacterium]
MISPGPWKAYLLTVAILPASQAAAALTGLITLRDPSQIVKQGDSYYIVATGRNILIRRSEDLVHWTDDGRVFDSAPAWTTQVVDGFQPTFDFWAPEIIHAGGEYRVYYSASTWGSQDSAIGLATNATLDRSDPNYAWVDRGLVIQSNPGDPFNTIDPSVLHGDDGRMWLSFGSYWNGIYITELDPTTGLRISPASGLTPLARNLPSSSIEASYLHQRGDDYYLFVNWGSCCAGPDSTYNIRVGRSTSPTGPFYDQAGKNMYSGGGTLVLASEGERIGPGHAGIFEENGVEYFGYHYEGTRLNSAKFDIRRLGWTPDGWPVMADAFAAADFDFNGVVDGADLAAWQDQYGRGPSADADGDSDGGDFLTWQREVGTTAYPTAGASIPEPASLTLMGLLLVLRRSIAPSAGGHLPPVWRD